MSPSWGETYYDHYVSFFGDPAGRVVFRRGDDSPSIQILWFDEVFPGCRVFTTLGASHYAEELHGISELILPLDSRWADVPGLMANAVFHLIQNGTPLMHGATIGGFVAINPDFVSETRKDALYIAEPYGLPRGFGRIVRGGQVARVYLGILISNDELRCCMEHGAGRLETLIEDSGADPFDVMRDSSV